MKVFKKNTKLSLGLIAIIVLCSTALLGVIAAVTDGFQDFEFRQVNEDNLINVDNYVSTLDGYNENGIKVTVNDDGVIAVKGKVEIDDDYEYTYIQVTSVDLKAGNEYTLSCDGTKGIDDKTYYLALGDGEDHMRVCVLDKSNDDVTFKVENDTSVDLYIIICNGEKIDTTFKPVLVADDEPGDFYVFSNK